MMDAMTRALVATDEIPRVSLDWRAHANRPPAPLTPAELARAARF